MATDSPQIKNILTLLEEPVHNRSSAVSYLHFRILKDIMLRSTAAQMQKVADKLLQEFREMVWES